jgi:hypothetical protein
MTTRNIRFILFGAVMLAFTACNSGQTVFTGSPETKPEPKAIVEQTTPPSPWYVHKSTNEISEEVTVTASNGNGKERLVIRRIGKKLEVYVKTGKFLETIEAMHSGGSVVRYKFDSGAVVRQTWSMSSDNEGLFYPGNPSTFLRRMSQAKRLVIEYEPADTVPETASFDITQFPVEFVQRESK